MAEETEIKAEEVTEGSQAAEEGKKPEPQSREENAQFAQQRREREAKAKAEAEESAKEAERIKGEAYLQGKIDQAQVNPYTKKPIKTEEDLRILACMKKADEEGKDPRDGYEAYFEELHRKEAEAKAKAEAEAKAKSEKEQAEAKQAEEVKRQTEETRNAFPDVDLDELSKDPRFIKFSKGKFGSMELKEIVADFIEMFPKSPKAQTKKSGMSSKQGGTKAEKSFSEMTADEYVEYCKRVYGGF